MWSDYHFHLYKSYPNVDNCLCGCRDCRSLKKLRSGAVSGKLQPLSSVNKLLKMHSLNQISCRMPLLPFGQVGDMHNLMVTWEPAYQFNITHNGLMRRWLNIFICSAHKLGREEVCTVKVSVLSWSQHWAGPFVLQSVNQSAVAVNNFGGAVRNFFNDADMPETFALGDGVHGCMIGPWRGGEFDLCVTVAVPLQRYQHPGLNLLLSDGPQHH